MKSVGLFVTLLVVLAFAPVAVLGQALPGLGAAPQTVYLPGFDMGFVRLVPSVGFGYERVGLNFSLPTSPSFGVSLLGLSVPISSSQALDIRLSRARVWLAEVGLDAFIGSGLSFFANGRTTFPKKVTVESGSDQSFTVSIVQFSADFPLRWEGSKLKMWEIDCGAQYLMGNGLTFIGGVRYDRVSLDLDDPAAPGANLTSLMPDEFSPFVDSLRAVGDIRSKLWIPFVGAAVDGPNYQASILWSPCVLARVDVPVGLLVAITDTNFLDTSGNTFEASGKFGWSFNVFKAAAFLEGKFEYDYSLSPRNFLTLWVRGTYLDVTGTGDLEADVPWSFTSGGFPVMSGSEQAGDSQSAKFRRHTLSLGILASYFF